MDKTKIQPIDQSAIEAAGTAAKGGRAGLAVSETKVKAGGGGGRSFYDLGKQ